MTLHYGRNLLPSSVGFDRLLSTIEDFEGMFANQKPQAYPPYNILKLNDTNYQIQLAVSGFTRADLDIEFKDGKLTVTGKQGPTVDGIEYLHRGIAARDFVHNFVLADTVVVRSADIVNGLLVITLENIIPEEKKPRKIEIGVVETQHPSLEKLLTEAK